jgi:phosphohistidine phosphatase
MILWLIRHGVAADAEAFRGPDLDRPLTPGGRRQAQSFFAHLAKARPAPDAVISSAAVRARATAEILCKAYDLPSPIMVPKLNPGARFGSFKKVASAYADECACIAIVGHEPDLSNALSKWVAGGALNAPFKKCALAELELRPGRSARLLTLVAPDLLLTPV